MGRKKRTNRCGSQAPSSRRVPAICFSLRRRSGKRAFERQRSSPLFQRRARSSVRLCNRPALSNGARILVFGRIAGAVMHALAFPVAAQPGKPCSCHDGVRFAAREQALFGKLPVRASTGANPQRHVWVSAQKQPDTLSGPYARRENRASRTRPSFRLGANDQEALILNNRSKAVAAGTERTRRPEQNLRKSWSVVRRRQGNPHRRAVYRLPVEFLRASRVRQASRRPSAYGACHRVWSGRIRACL